MITQLKHKMSIKYKDGTRLGCSCGGWSVKFEGEITKNEAKSRHTEHLVRRLVELQKHD